MEEELDNLHPNIMCLGEMNINWHDKRNQSQLKDMLNGTTCTLHLAASTSKVSELPEHKDTPYLPGGTAMWVCNQWAAKIAKSGEDP